MTIHTAIGDVLRAYDVGIRPTLVDAIVAAVTNAQIDERQPVGIDQGVSRLALLGFIRDEPGPWNGERNIAGKRSAWVRYRAHQITREQSPDGLVIHVAYHDHLNRGVSATFTPRGDLDDVSAALLVADDVDDLIDAVLATHGADGSPLVDAEIIEPITSDVARRVLDAYMRWIREQPLDVRLFGGGPDFLAAIDAGTVEP